MRFMVMVKVTEEPEVQPLPTIAMGEFNERLTRDGVVLAAEGLQASSTGTRITYAGGKPTFTDGPFAESKEVVAGFWILQARSKEEIVERMRHCPFEGGEFVEIRPIAEFADFRDALEADGQQGRVEKRADLEREWRANAQRS